MLRGTRLVGSFVLGSMLVLGVTGCDGQDVGPDGPDLSTTTAALGGGGGQFCGGFAGFPCPDGLRCVDDPTDDCDPTNGGEDCAGVCRPGQGQGGNNAGGNGRACGRLHQGAWYASHDPDHCAVISFLCREGTVLFSDDCGCGCEPAGEACGPTTCRVGEVCCNSSCGICTAPDGFCIQIACEPTN